MGYLDNSALTVEAILTKKGRERLAKQGKLDITKFALSDDEIDYRLWNPADSRGSDYYGAAIDAMALTEANPDETQTMRYKLLTLGRFVVQIPLLSIGADAITLQGQGSTYNFSPTTQNGDDQTAGYTAIIENVDYVDIIPVNVAIPQQQAAVAQQAPEGGVSPATRPTTQVATAPTIFLGDAVRSQSKTVSGFSFRLTAKNITPFLRNSGAGLRSNQAYLTTKLTVIGNATGGSRTVTVTIYSGVITQQEAQSAS